MLLFLKPRNRNKILLYAQRHDDLLRDGRGWQITFLTLCLLCLSVPAVLRRAKISRPGDGPAALHRRQRAHGQLPLQPSLLRQRLPAFLHRREPHRYARCAPSSHTLHVCVACLVCSLSPCRRFSGRWWQHSHPGPKQTARECVSEARFNCSQEKIRLWIDSAAGNESNVQYLV